MIKVGLIGAGFMGSMHASCYEALLAEGGFNVIAVADLDSARAEKLASKFGAKIFKTGKELIESGEVNTVDICLPTYLHAQHAIFAMEKGLNVLVEKPVCLNEEEAAKLLEVKKKTGAKAAVAQCIRFWPEYMYLKKVFDEKTYGSIVSAVFKRISPKPTWAWENWLHDYKKSGSAVLDLHVHDIDYIRYIFGEPDSIKGSMTTVEGRNEHIFSIFQYDKVAVSIEGGWDYPAGLPFEMEYRVKFDKAVVTYNSAKTPGLAVYLEDGSTVNPVLEDNFESKSEESGGNLSSLGGYYNEIKYFLNCLKNGEDIKIISIEEGVASLRLLMKEIKAVEGK
jgi:Predicted dehydrogenases and related proteins